MGFLSDWKNMVTLGNEIRDLKKRVAALEQKDIDQDAALNQDGGSLAEVREVRERIYPLFAQGADANAAMIAKVNSIP